MPLLYSDCSSPPEILPNQCEYYTVCVSCLRWRRVLADQGGEFRGGNCILGVFWNLTIDQKEVHRACFPFQRGNQREYSSITLCSCCFMMLCYMGPERSKICCSFSISNYNLVCRTSIIGCCSVWILLLLLSLKRRHKSEGYSFPSCFL